MIYETVVVLIPGPNTKIMQNEESKLEYEKRLR